MDDEIQFLSLFNPTFMKDPHGQEMSDIQDQILFHYPPNQSLNSQMVQIGLAQTLHAFTLQFQSNNSIDDHQLVNSLQSSAFPQQEPPLRSRRSSKVQERNHVIWKCSKTKSMLFRMEGNYWMLLSVRFGIKKTRDKLGKDSKIIVDWRITDEFMSWMATQILNRFKLLYHSFSHLYSECNDNVELFKQKIDAFFSTSVLVLQRACSNPGLEYVNCGIKNAPFDEATFGKVVTLAARLSSIIPSLSGQFMLLYHDLLAWSSLPTHLDTKLLYEFLTDPLTGNIDDSLINQVKPRGEPVITGSDYKSKSTFSGFLIGPELYTLDSLSNTHRHFQSSPSTTLKHVYLFDGSRQAIILYQWSSQFTICLLSPNTPECPDLERLDWYLFLQQTLSGLLQTLHDFLQLNRRRVPRSLTTSTPNGNYYALSVNLTTLVIKSWLVAKKPMNVDILSKARQLLSSVPRNDQHREVLMKVPNCGWIFAMISGLGQVIIVINKEDITLGSIQGEINYLKGIIQFTLVHS